MFFRALLALALVCSLVVAGCGRQVTRAERQDPHLQQVTVGRSSRPYFLSQPDKCKREACPAVLWLHGEDQSSHNAVADGTLERLAEKHGFVLFTPASPYGNWMNATESRSTIGDWQFLEALLDVIKTHPIDHKRIYVVGEGRGGWMAQKLAAAHADSVAAVAEAGSSVAMLDSQWNFHSLPEPSRGVPILMMHGMLDDVCGYDMRSFSLDIPSSAEWWAQRVTPGATKERNELSNGAILQDKWSGADGKEVQLLSFKDLAHEWPGTRDEVDGFATNEAVWAFVSRYSLP